MVVEYNENMLDLSKENGIIQCIMSVYFLVKDKSVSVDRIIMSTFNILYHA
jgi:hypothetical protein